MQEPERLLTAIAKLGQKRKPLQNIYRALYNPQLYLAAYGKLYANRGATTKGINDEGIDGMSQKRIEVIIADMRHERFKFAPARRIYIDKKNNEKRPIDIPRWQDKLVQEVIRMILSAYFEPQFQDCSHGFRPKRGCHTALKKIVYTFTATKWFIEGDIKGCFSNINHTILLDILRRNIEDNRFIRLIAQGLSAGIMEGWQYQRTYSGVPQGSILGPVLSNIYLNELDLYIQETLIPQWTRGKTRQHNREYSKLQWAETRARAHGNIKEAKELARQKRKTAALDTHDEAYRRLKYIRYCDDFILGFVGPKHEAEQIKQQISVFLQEKLHLQMSESKTLITHARTKQAHFLGYAVSTIWTENRRKLNGGIRLDIPKGRINEWCRPYLSQGKPTHRKVSLRDSVPEIINHYQMKFRGIAEYYKFAQNRAKLGKLKWVMQVSLVKTLANKLRISSRKVYQRYASTIQVGSRRYKVLQVMIPRKEGKPITFTWGGISLAVQNIRASKELMTDEITPLYVNSRNEMVDRLMADKCELCGQKGRTEGHHVRKLKDLKKRWRGRREKPEWVKRMIARNRKTLFVCQPCHQAIHAGKITTVEKLSQLGSLESRMR